MKIILTIIVVIIAVAMTANASTRPSDTNTVFLIETATLNTFVSAFDLPPLEDRYRAYFESYDIPITTNLYHAYSGVLYQYLRALKLAGKYTQAIQLLDEKKQLLIDHKIKHMLYPMRADILVEMAEKESEPKKTELLDEARRVLGQLQW
jgi:hypothetical protein